MPRTQLLKSQILGLVHDDYMVLATSMIHVDMSHIINCEWGCSKSLLVEVGICYIDNVVIPLRIIIVVSWNDTREFVSEE